MRGREKEGLGEREGREIEGERLYGGEEKTESDRGRGLIMVRGSMPVALQWKDSNNKTLCCFMTANLQIRGLPISLSLFLCHSLPLPLCLSFSVSPSVYLFVGTSSHKHITHKSSVCALENVVTAVLSLSLVITGEWRGGPDQ